MVDNLRNALCLFNQSYTTPPLILPVEHYRQKLIEYLFELYINRNQIQKETQEAYDSAIVLAYFLNPTNSDLSNAVKKITKKRTYREYTQDIIKDHLQKTMQILGNICELMLIDHCIDNKLINQKCINIATFKSDISTMYSDIDYDSYIPFSPAKSFIRNAQGFLVSNPFGYSGNHPTQDILWHHKDKKNDILQFHIEPSQPKLLASLQIKTTSDIKYHIRSDKYILSPIIGINLENKFNFTYNSKANAQIAVSIRDLDSSLAEEALIYFKLMIAHLANLWNLEIPIVDDDYLNNGALRYLLCTSINDLLSDQILIEREEKVMKVKDWIKNNSSTNDVIGITIK